MLKSSDELNTLRTLIQQVQAVNERSTVLANLVRFLCKMQQAFIIGGERIQ